jgi:glycine reductase
MTTADAVPGQTLNIEFEMITKEKRGETMFKGKKVIIVGERDGVPGPAIAQCVRAGGGEVAYMTTECFV